MDEGDVTGIKEVEKDEVEVEEEEEVVVMVAEEVSAGKKIYI
jgi:hypothetical protein